MAALNHPALSPKALTVTRVSLHSVGTHVPLNRVTPPSPMRNGSDGSFVSAIVTPPSTCRAAPVAGISKVVERAPRTLDGSVRSLRE